MRSDMAEVIIEPSRRVGHKAMRRQHKKTGLRIRNYDPDKEYDDLPTRLPSSRHKQYGRRVKDMTDLLTPIDRYFRSNVGRPWDQIWSEICQQIDRRNMAKNHLFEHIDGYVETDCFIGDDDKIYAYTNRGVYEVSAEDSTWFYVHPNTGLLCQTDNSAWRRTQKVAKKVAQTAWLNWRVPVKGKRNYVKLNGLWYIADLEHYCKGQRPPEEEAQMTLLQDRWRVLNKRQCGKKELKAAGLSNDRPK